jgi:hypothetical protein
MKKTFAIFIVVFLLLFSLKICFCQSNCSTAQQVCLSDTNTYPMSVSTMSEPGPNLVALFLIQTQAGILLKFQIPVI